MNPGNNHYYQLPRYIEWVLRKSLQVVNFVFIHLRKIIVFIIGITFVLVGSLLIFLPGPATVVIPLGLFILASEFAWARFILRKMRQEGGKFLSQIQSMILKKHGDKLDKD